MDHQQFQLSKPILDGRYLIFAMLILLLATLQPLAALPIIPEEKTSLVQLTASEHILGFQSDSVYVANGDHVLQVSFATTQEVEPIIDNHSSDKSKSQPLSKVSYKGLWPGIDLKYEAVDSGIVESIWTIAPGADPEQIRLSYNRPVEIENNGSLKINYETGWMQESAPIAWQNISGRRIPVQVAFHQTKSYENQPLIGFQFGEYDPDYSLLVDPVLEWNTTIGSAGNDEGHAIAVSLSGDIYIAGTSYTTWGTSPENPHSGTSRDIFVAKLNASGVLQWNTFMGGELATEKVESIAIDSSNNVYVAGSSDRSWGTPVTGEEYVGSSDAFVAKLNNTGVRLWHAFMGSTAWDGGYGVDVDSFGNVYVAGYGYGDWAATAINSYSGDFEVFVAKFNSSGVRQWHTFMGSAGGDSGYDISVDSSDNVYVTGQSSATWGTQPVAPFIGGGDTFVAKLSNSGNRVWNTFLGSTGFDEAKAITVDGSDNIYIAGSSSATWGLPINDHAGGSGYDAFIAKLNSSTGVLNWNTFMGSTSDDQGFAIDVGGNDSISVVGRSAASWGYSPISPYLGDRDAFVASLDNNGGFKWNAFMGSVNRDNGRGVATLQTSMVGKSPERFVYAIGYDEGGGDAFVYKYAPSPPDNCAFFVVPNQSNGMTAICL